MNGVKIEPTAIRAHRLKTYKALLTFLPPKFGYGRKLAASLNKAGKSSARGRAYNEIGVHSIINQGTYDRHIEDALVKMVVEYTGVPIKKLMPRYKPTYSIGAANVPEEV